MPENNDERRFSESEFALILRRAIEMDVEPVKVPPGAPPPRLPPEGLTLSEIEAIASEVGIKPGRIAEALESIEGSGGSPSARLFGGPVRLKSERILGRRLEPEELGRLLDIVRGDLETQGESHEVLGGVEWKNDSKLAEIQVRIAPHGDASKLVVSVDRGSGAFLSHYVPIMACLGVVGVAIGVLQPSSSVAIAGLIAGGAGCGYGIGRTIWVTSTRRWQERIRRLTSRIVRRSEEDSEESRLPAGDEPFDD